MADYIENKFDCRFNSFSEEEDGILFYVDVFMFQ